MSSQEPYHSHQIFAIVLTIAFDSSRTLPNYVTINRAVTREGHPKTKSTEAAKRKNVSGQNNTSLLIIFQNNLILVKLKSFVTSYDFTCQIQVRSGDWRFTSWWTIFSLNCLLLYLPRTCGSQINLLLFVSSCTSRSIEGALLQFGSGERLIKCS